ncbi:hypothetical protein ACFWIQ_22995 [Kitasatospora sp. NPDC127059]|uniref:hypothetical protein n=1 Tax=unclassified Kitasatospora TaxID=2633591 RepID=UPI0036561F58
MNAPAPAPRRPSRGLVRAVAGAVAVATLGSAGTVGASAAIPSAGGPARAGAVLVREVRTADGVLAVDRSTEPPQPASGGGCSGIDPQVCFSVDGSGFFVHEMTNSTHYGSSTSADIKVRSPSGVVVAESTFYAVGGNWYTVTYAPNAYLAEGRWCALSNANGGGYTGTCVDVHN